MRSALPKVLHTLGGRHLLQHVLGAAAGLGSARVIVVTGHGAAEVERRTSAPGLSFVRQEPQLGTGHALQQAAPLLDDDGITLILNGDVPLIETATLERLLAAAGPNRLALLTIALADAHGYGRIVRGGDGAVAAIVEEKDASPEQRAIRDYTGVMAAPTRRPASGWRRCATTTPRASTPTDVVASAVSEGVAVTGIAAGNETEVLGVNSPTQLADLERRYQRAAAERLMAAGVRLADPARFDQRGGLVCGHDVEIDVGCIFDGNVELGDGVRIGAYCMLKNVSVAAGATIRPYTHIDGEALGASIGAGAIVGPFSRLRGGAMLGADVHVGNFVESKAPTLAAGEGESPAYIGDSDVGERVN
jgi:bifunctional UDP-N-acetylglucosamine pyrophosphorylase/glucosamine-1-phosphate N-acetyltransferase